MTVSRPLRRDAAANRAKVVAAAGEVFAEHGLDAGVEEIARRAGVGMGTLYRSFGNKEQLIDELIGGLRRDLLELARQALNRADGEGLEGLLHTIGTLQAEQSGCLARLWDHSNAELSTLDEFRQTIAQLLTRAQEHGRIRAEVTPTDISMLFWSLRGVIETTRVAAPTAWRRHLELLVAGLRPPGDPRFAAPLGQNPVSAAQARQVLVTGYRD